MGWKLLVYVIYAIVLIYLLYNNPKTFLLLTGIGLLYYALEEIETKHPETHPSGFRQATANPLHATAKVSQLPGILGGKEGYGNVMCKSTPQKQTTDTACGVTGGGAPQKKTQENNATRTLGHKTEKMLLQVLHSRGFTGFRLNQKPKWLQLPDDVSGKPVQLELDLYDEENNVAIEYNGPQHYSADSKYWPDFYTYAKYIKNSVAKEMICRENGVELVTVPYTVPISQLYNYTKSRFWDNQYIRDTYGLNRPRGDKYLPEQVLRIEKINEILTGVVSRDLQEAMEI